jgi:hypothetical protein
MLGLTRSAPAVIAAATASFGVAYAGGSVLRGDPGDGPVQRPAPAAAAVGVHVAGLGGAARLPGLRVPPAARRPTVAPAVAVAQPVGRPAPAAPAPAARRAPAAAPRPTATPKPAATHTPAPAQAAPKADKPAAQPVTFFDDGE